MQSILSLLRLQGISEAVSRCEMHLLPAHASPTKQRDEKANETLLYLNSVARADQALKLDAHRGKIAIVVVIAHLLEEPLT